MWQSRIYRIALINLLLVVFAVPSLPNLKNRKEYARRDSCTLADPGAIESRIYYLVRAERQ